MKRAANFSVPGSGKTASVLGVYACLKSRELIRRLVVVCPKNAFGSWMEEFVQRFAGREEPRVLNLHGPGLTTAAALRYDAGNVNLILVNYKSAGGVLEDLLPLVRSQSLLVLDEVHKVKKVGASAALAPAEVETVNNRRQPFFCRTTKEQLEVRVPARRLPRRRLF